MAKDKKKLRHKIIAVASSFMLLAHGAYSLHNSTLASYLFEQHKEVNVKMEPYGKYSFGNVYIGSSVKIRAIEDKVNPTDILVIDCANDKDRPEYKILNSYRVKTIVEKIEILSLIFDYDGNKNTTLWDRTFSAALFEWMGHNGSHAFHFQRDRTTDVDLDNDDEYKYKLFTKSK